MNLFARLFRRKVKIPLRPDPDFRTRRLAQFTPERRERYWENIRKAGL